MNKYKVKQKIEVWVETEVKANNEQEALKHAQEKNLWIYSTFYTSLDGYIIEDKIKYELFPAHIKIKKEPIKFIPAFNEVKIEKC